MTPLESIELHQHKLPLKDVGFGFRKILLATKLEVDDKSGLQSRNPVSQVITLTDDPQQNSLGLFLIL